jgi:Protein of unknown function (DUF3667)
MPEPWSPRHGSVVCGLWPRIFDWRGRVHPHRSPPVGRIGHSLVSLIVHPGQLTAEFRDGQRARSINPWRLALNVVAIFFVLSFVTNFRIANFPKQNPSGELANAISAGAQEAKVAEITFMERVDRRFNAIYTVFVTLSIASFAVLARLTHWRRPERWSVHFVFALHFTAWTFIANLVYYLAMRSLGLSATYESQSHAAGAALLGLIIFWQFSYMLLAFRRVYADTWIGAGAKAMVVVVVGVLIGNMVMVLSFWLAVKTVSHVA